MKILNTQQIRLADAYTIKNEPIKAIDLMERAATKCYNWLQLNYNKNTHFSIFCGVGNNGGDGLVIARLLQQNNYKVTVYIVDFSKKYALDFKTNLLRLKKAKATPQYLNKGKCKINLSKNTVIIDAIFGSGLTRPINGFIADIILQINQLPNDTIAIDIPSGLFGEDNTANKKDNIIFAKHTLTFQQPKLAFMFPENYEFVGNFDVLDIGLHQKYLLQVATPYHLITKSTIQAFIHSRNKFAHKGNFGHALIIAGSKGKIGAAVLAAKAGLKSGVGLLTTHLPNVGLNVMQTAVPEVMCISDSEQNYISALQNLDKYNVIGVGPGIGLAKQTQNVIKLLIQNTQTPLVLDADALNILAENKTWLSFLPPDSILTPHPKEFERLAGKWNNDEERLTLQRAFAVKHNVFVALKGANTSITTPNNEVYFNSTGNPGMATAGSGDVLTGIITGLLAQHYTPQQAVLLGVYLHGLSGDIAKENLGEASLMASDLINFLPQAFGWLKI